MKRHLFIFFLLISLFFLGFTQGDTSKSQYTLPIGAYSVWADDLDLDGDNDIIVGHNYDSQTQWGGVSVLKNNPIGNFSLSDSLFSYAWQPEIQTAQLNQNPIPDIIYIKDNSVTEFIGIIFDFDFTDTVYLDTYTYDGIEYITTGDIDNNGLTDIVYSSNQGQFWGILFNLGDEIFSQPEYHYVTGYYPTDIAVGDLNNDGRDDVVICGQNTEVYFSYASGFQCLLIEQNYPRNGVKISDLNLDGMNDVLTVVGLDYIPTSILAVFKNEGNNSFSHLPDFSFQPGTNRFFVTDFNNDSLPDVLFQKNDFSGHIIFYNQGNFQLGDSQHVSVPDYGEGWRNIHCAEMDNNGYNDIITVRTIYTQIPSNLDILFNDGNGNFGPDPIVNIIEITSSHEFTFRNFPNPFHHETIFEFRLDEPQHVSITIYDLHGQHICQVANKHFTNGLHRICWNGTNRLGTSCSPGIYQASLHLMGSENYSIKIIKQY